MGAAAGRGFPGRRPTPGICVGRALCLFLLFGCSVSLVPQRHVQCAAAGPICNNRGFLAAVAVVVGVLCQTGSSCVCKWRSGVTVKLDRCLAVTGVSRRSIRPGWRQFQEGRALHMQTQQQSWSLTGADRAGWLDRAERVAI